MLQVRVRLSETNARGCADDVSLLVLFEAARADILRELGLPYAEIVERGLQALTVDAILKNHGCARADDALVVHAYFRETGRVRFSFIYEIRREVDDVLIATGQTVHILVDAKQGQPARVPDWFAEPLRKVATID